jgi:hypothetical protein
MDNVNFEWWSCMDAAGKAAWVQAGVSILALFVAILISWWERRQARLEKGENERKIVMGAAARLDALLRYESVVLGFAPEGDGVIGHEMDLKQAIYFMKLGPETRSAMKEAVEKAHFFDQEVCERIIYLASRVAEYEKLVEDGGSRPNMTPDAFFKMMRGPKNQLVELVEEVRRLLQKYLPKVLREEYVEES